MIFGPFSEQHLKSITEILDKEGIPYSIDVSTTALEEWRNARKEHHPMTYPTFKGLVEGSFLEIADRDLPRIANKLENYGIFEPQERPTELDAFDDFICPQCDFAGHATQLCPRHLTPLVSFSEKVAAQRIVTDTRKKVINWSLLIVLLFVVFSSYCSHTKRGGQVVWPWELIKTKSH